MMARRSSRAAQLGLTLVELMVAMAISLVILAALVQLFVNLSANHREMEKMNGVIVNGRFSMQVFQDDLVHAGFWGGYVPQFDDFTADVSMIPDDVPTIVLDPCAPWGDTKAEREAFIGLPVQSYETLPAGTGCVSPLTQRAGTDVLVVRHAETCVAGVGTCDPVVAGRLYFQPTFCEAERNTSTAADGAASTITLATGASNVDDAYVGVTIRTVSGVGPGQIRAIVDYDGATRVATVSTPWVTVPSGVPIGTTPATGYAFEYALGTTAFPLHKRDCVGTGTTPVLPITAGTLSDQRRMMSSIYYVTDVAHPDVSGQVIPTLVRAQLDVSGGVPAHTAPVPLVEGVEAMRIELGIDDVSKTGVAVDYTAPIDWADPMTKRTPTNRGDGVPDFFIRCTDAAPCTAEQLTNVVAVKFHVLARSRDTTPGQTDTKVYCLAELDLDGDCPADGVVGPMNDQYKRHVFTSSVRVTNVSGRRETPP